MKSFLIAVIAVCLCVVSAVTDEEKNALKEAIIPIVRDCAQQLGVTKEAILAARDSKNIDGVDPCLYACFFKATGIIDEAGLYVPEVGLEKNKKYIKGEDDLKKIAETGETCKSVNDATVTDGAKACERSKLLLSCFLKERAIFTPF